MPTAAAAVAIYQESMVYVGSSSFFTRDRFLKSESRRLKSVKTDCDQFETKMRPRLRPKRDIDFVTVATALRPKCDKEIDKKKGLKPV